MWSCSIQWKHQNKLGASEVMATKLALFLFLSHCPSVDVLNLCLIETGHCIWIVLINDKQTVTDSDVCFKRNFFCQKLLFTTLLFSYASVKDNWQKVVFTFQVLLLLLSLLHPHPSHLVVIATPLS